jgi:CARDB
MVNIMLFNRVNGKCHSNSLTKILEGKMNYFNFYKMSSRLLKEHCMYSARLYVFMLMIIAGQQKLILAEPIETVFEFHTVEVQVGSDNELGDPNVSHNTGGNQPITQAGLPDLIITQTTIEETACNTYKLCYSMRNASSDSVGALVDNFIYIDGVHKFSNINLFPLLPNSTLYSCGTFTLPGTECNQEHTVQVCADGNNEQAESNESNNCGVLVPFQHTGQIIATDKTVIDFGNTSEVEILGIWNDSSCCPLDYSTQIVTGSSYFDITPPDGTSTGSSDQNFHDISVNRAVIARGETVFGQLSISATANNSPVDISLSASRYLTDFNADGFVDTSDLLMLAAAWLMYDSSVDTGPIAAPDGFINFFDFSIVSRQWLAGY